MKLTIDIPDDKAPQIIDNICAATNYKPESGTKAAWAKAKVIDFIKATNQQGAMKSARDAQTAITTGIA